MNVRDLRKLAGDEKLDMPPESILQRVGRHGAEHEHLRANVRGDGVGGCRSAATVEGGEARAANQGEEY